MTRRARIAAIRRICWDVPVIPVLRTLVVLLVAVAAAAGTTPPAAAVPISVGPAETCEPVDLDRPDATEIRNRADAVSDVFVGQVRAVVARETVGGGEGKVTTPPTGSTPEATQQPEGTFSGWEHTVSVVAGFRGDTPRGARVKVVTQPTGEEGLGKLRPGRTYLFFAEGEPGMDHLTAAACAGTTLLPAGPRVRWERILQAALEEPPAEPAPPQVTLTAPENGAGEAPAFTRIAAPGLALALIGVLGLLLLARAGTRRT